MSALVLQYRVDGSGLVDRIYEARGILREAVERYRPVAVFALVSGGTDSVTMLSLMRSEIDGVAHVNTGIGVEETREYVRSLCHDWWLPLRELFPPKRTYEDIVMEYGFPGPRDHSRIFRELKKESLRTLQREVVPERSGGVVMFLTGERSQESDRRMGYSSVHRLERDARKVAWVNPIHHWSAGEKALYLTLHSEIPKNPVWDVLNKSGECLCGCFGHPADKEVLRLYYPDTAAYIDSLERKVEASGHPSHTWGPGGQPPKRRERFALCASCGTGNLFTAPPPQEERPR